MYYNIKVKRFVLKSTILFILLMTISTPFVMHAESSINESDVNVEINPQNPAPGKNVTITVSSYSANLNRAQIDWKDNAGNVLSSGVGSTSYSLVAGGPNSDVNVQVYITPYGDSTAVVKQIFIHPTDVDILWQSIDGYVPPFYKGKALPTSESVIRAVAMPNAGAVANNNNIVYTWKLEHNTMSKFSGYGKDSFTFENSYLRNTEHINVSASSVNGSYNAENSITIPIQKSKVLFYLKNQDGTVNYSNALADNSQISGEESTIVAEPYFFPLTSGAGSLKYTWKINGGAIDTPRNPLSLTIRPASTGGYATISLSIDNISKLFQSVSNTLKLNL